MGCRVSKTKKRRNAFVGNLEAAILASETSFTVNEVEALFILYKQLSSSIIDDGKINKEEFQLALLGDSRRKNLFLDRVFALFDVNQNGVIEFGGFVRSMSIFNPKASQAAKIQFAFNLYDKRHTGYIERDELKEMVLAILEEINLVLSDDSVEAMLDKTFADVDSKRDGKIDPEEWREFVAKNPYLMKSMTLEYLKELSIIFPSFIMSSQVEDSDLEAAAAGKGHDNGRFHCHRVVPGNSSAYGVKEPCADAALVRQGLKGV